MPWQAQFVLLSVAWGCSFLFIKLGVESFTPLWVSFGRVLLGAASLLLVLSVSRSSLPRSPRVWLHLAVAALLVNSLPFSLFVWAETHVTSIVAGIWNATTPLLVLLVAMLALPDERPTRRRVAGLVLGFAGAIVLLGPWNGPGGGAALGHLAAFGAAACYGVGFPYIRRNLSPLGYSATALATGQLACATVELALVAPLVGGAPRSLSPAAVAGVVALGVLGTGLAYLLNYGIIRAAGATVASTVAYVIPLVSTVLGVAALHERLSWNEPVGALVVVLGVAVTQGGRFVVSRASEDEERHRGVLAPGCGDHERVEDLVVAEHGWDRVGLAHGVDDPAGRIEHAAGEE